MAHLADQDFDLDAERPESVRSTNLTDGEIDTNGTALWAITWKQALDVSNVIDRPDLDDFLRCFARKKADGPVNIEIHLPGPDAPEKKE